MATTNYAKMLVEDINNLKKKYIRRNIKLNNPVYINVEIRIDTDYTIDFVMEKIAVDRFSVKKNFFGDYEILVANGKHNIVFLSEESYNEIKRQIK